MGWYWGWCNLYAAHHCMDVESCKLALPIWGNHRIDASLLFRRNYSVVHLYGMYIP